MNQIKFIKKKVAAYETIAKEVLTQPEFHTGLNGADFVRESLTVQCERFILQRLNEEQPITVTLAPPTFWDWLKGRRPSCLVTFRSYEVLKNPPVLPKGQSELIFIVEQDNDE